MQIKKKKSLQASKYSKANQIEFDELLQSIQTQIFLWQYRNHCWKQLFPIMCTTCLDYV